MELIGDSTKQQYQASSTQNSPYSIEAAIRASQTDYLGRIKLPALLLQFILHNNPHCDELMAWKPVGMCLIPHHDTPRDRQLSAPGDYHMVVGYHTKIGSTLNYTRISYEDTENLHKLHNQPCSSIV